MTRAARALTAAIAVLLLVAVGTLVVRPLHDMRSDIDAQRSLLAQQLATTRDQLAVAREQLEVAQDTRDTARVVRRTGGGTRPQPVTRRAPVVPLVVRLT